MKRCLIILTIALSLSLTFVGFAKPAHALGVGCSALSGVGPSTFIVSGTSSIVVSGTPPTSNGTFTIHIPAGLTVTYSGDLNTSVSGPVTSLVGGFLPNNTITVTISGAAIPWTATYCNLRIGGSGSFFGDGRLNSEPWQTAAIYCMGDGSVRVYTPGIPLWLIAFTASPKDIDAVPTHPKVNTLIKSGRTARLYRLTTGELQVNSPALDPAKGDYVFIFHDCPRPL